MCVHPRLRADGQAGSLPACPAVRVVVEKKLPEKQAYDPGVAYFTRYLSVDLSVASSVFRPDGEGASFLFITACLIRAQG